jgi:hypothetical protein
MASGVTVQLGAATSAPASSPSSWLTIDRRHHQRHFRIQPVGIAEVNHGHAGSAGLRDIFARHIAAGHKNGQRHILETEFIKLTDIQLQIAIANGRRLMFRAINGKHTFCRTGVRPAVREQIGQPGQRHLLQQAASSE